MRAGARLSAGRHDSGENDVDAGEELLTIVVGAQPARHTSDERVLGRVEVSQRRATASRNSLRLLDPAAADAFIAFWLPTPTM
jgi:hypothetical protein